MLKLPENNLQGKPRLLKSKMCFYHFSELPSYSPSSASVLAVRGASINHQGEPVGEPDSDLGTQPHYRFTRQPVKYYRHHNPGFRLSNPSRAARQPAAPVRCRPGSADSSRSSSPEPGTQRLSQNLDVCCENAHQAHQSTAATEGKMDAPLSPREVVQYMLGLHSSPSNVTSSSVTQESSQVEADLNTNMSNNRQSAGQSRTLCHSPKTLPVEHNLTSPALKILSGLKLRRSHSGKDEQLFV